MKTLFFSNMSKSRRLTSTFFPTKSILMSQIARASYIKSLTTQTIHLAVLCRIRCRWAGAVSQLSFTDGLIWPIGLFHVHIVHTIHFFYFIRDNLFWTQPGFSQIFCCFEAQCFLNCSYFFNTWKSKKVYKYTI